ncbi:MAG: hypothetical protein WA696_06805 [Solirubrobacterales bacterium]
MRAETKGKHGMGTRFAVVIGVAAAGVMALGAQTGTAASEGVVEYKTTLTIYKDGAELHGQVRSGVRECWQGREVIVFKKRPGPDRKLGATRSGPQAKSHNWRFWVKGANKEANEKVLRGGDVYAQVTPKMGDGFVCRADTSGMLWKTFPPSMRSTGDPVDSTPPDLQLSGPKKQDPQRDRIFDRDRCNVIVQVDVDEACTLRAWGKLTNVKMDKLDPPTWRYPEDFSPPSSIRWGPVKMGPELAKEKQRLEVRKALADGENVKAKVTVKATDAAGNVATAKRTITLVK